MKTEKEIAEKLESKIKEYKEISEITAEAERYSKINDRGILNLLEKEISALEWVFN